MGEAGFLFLYECAVYTMRSQMAVGIVKAVRSTGARQHAETLRGIDPGLIIVRVEPFRRPLGTFHQQLSLTPRPRFGKTKYKCGFPQSTRSLLLVRTFLTPR